VSALRPLPRFILPLDMGLFPQVIDRVERARTTGTDASGVPADAWDVVYSNLPCLADLHERGERGIQRGGGGGGGDVFGQPVEEVSGAFYVPQLPDGTLPEIRRRDRLVFGTWPTGETLYVDVGGAFDATAGRKLVLEVVGTARKPG
jgi:hypothetical protein